jgi:hypothetical protein
MFWNKMLIRNVYASLAPFAISVAIILKKKAKGRKESLKRNLPASAWWN